jgi:hypothetical protein
MAWTLEEITAKMAEYQGIIDGYRQNISDNNSAVLDLSNSTKELKSLIATYNDAMYSLLVLKQTAFPETIPTIEDKEAVVDAKIQSVTTAENKKLQTNPPIQTKP